MTLPVSPRAVIDEMDTFGDDFHPYLNQLTGELVTISNEEIQAVEEGADLDDDPEWEQDLIQKAAEVLSSTAYLPLPSKFDIHEYAIMERFCLALDDDELGRELSRQMHGSGAFRRFKDTVDRHNLLDMWFAYRQAAFAEIAMEWLEEHHIPYVRDEREVHR
jgi:hypothetical protein